MTNDWVSELANSKYQPKQVAQLELTHRQEEVVKLMLTGKCPKKIASALNLSPHTVMTHYKDISRVNGLKSQEEIAQAAILDGFVVGPDFHPLGGMIAEYQRLSKYKRKVFDAYGSGLSAPAVGKDLGKSPLTVRDQIKEIFTAFGISNSLQLTICWTLLKLAAQKEMQKREEEAKQQKDGAKNTHSGSAAGQAARPEAAPGVASFAERITKAPKESTRYR